ncbi:MAG: response regulator, partial [Thermoguttaceae bacterium]|nr:response regulator [Thermoguttaceae bacterium]
MTVSDPTVFLVEGNPQTRGRLAAVVSSLGLRLEAFAWAGEFLSAVDISRPGCAVADSRLPDMEGIQLHRRLRDLGSNLPVILIGSHLDMRMAAATEQGVFRVVEYPCRDEELCQALREAIAHDRKIRNRQMYRQDFAHRLASLDARERLALKLIVAGRTSKAIQHRLGVATRTMDRIRASILQKMNVQSFMELSAEYGAFEENGLASASTGAAVAGPPRPIGLFSGNAGAKPGAPCPAADATGQLLACDLHDGVAQYLTAGLLRVQAILGRDDLDGESVQLLRDAEATLSLALGE